MPRSTVCSTITTTAALLLLAGLANAQGPGELLIEIDRPVLAPGESTIVRLWAGYDSTRDFAMGGVATSLLADSGGVEIGDPWSDASLVGRMAGAGTRPVATRASSPGSSTGGRIPRRPTAAIPSPSGRPPLPRRRARAPSPSIYRR